MFETIVKINDYSETTTEEVNYITTGSINNLKWICSVEVLNWMKPLEIYKEAISTFSIESVNSSINNVNYAN